MNRSPILLTLFALAVTLLACASGRAADHDNDAVMNDTTHKHITFEGDFEGPLGLQLWSLREYTAGDLAGALQTARTMGFREVELAGTYGLTPSVFRKMLAAADLKGTSMHVDHDRIRDSVDVVLDEAVALAVEYVGLAWIPAQYREPFTFETARTEADYLNTWGAAAKARGLQFFYHVHGYEFAPGPDGRTPFDVIVEETDPGLVEFQMDVFWVANTGTDPAALLRRYPDRWTLMHVKDMKKGHQTGDHSGGAPAEADVAVGTGQIDYAGVLRAAKEIGIKRYYIEDESTDPLGNIPQSVAFLEKVQF